MNSTNVKENCTLLKNKLRNKFAELSEDDLDCSKRNHKEMLNNIQLKLGKTTQEMHEIILNLSTYKSFSEN